VVDRWWTEDPVSRRYFDVVLAGGRARGRVPGRGGGPLVQPARDVSPRSTFDEERVVLLAERGQVGAARSHSLTG
jgi:hypothetical protein